ncbi:MAG TPA: glycosyltransferase [Pseudobdellovibrionaceae bacterium]|nr:glycosyltransferase [Pseudobdellovibrionaceae bacterium]
MISFLASLVIFLAVTAIFALDDLHIDLQAWFRRLRPRRLTDADLAAWRQLPEKPIAILVANWHEADVIDRMLRGNLSRLDYSRYVFFVGVYPNDPETIAAAERMAQESARVIVITNPLPGPTTKGQMLNVIFREAIRLEAELGLQFELFAMHDSEDVLHPHSLRLFNVAAERADFIQIPVFSFARGGNQWVASTYMDEFAELHTKDLLVRNALRAGLPSAGVGTALSRKLVLTLMARQQGQVLREDSLTEDYILGMTAAELGFTSSFECAYIARKVPGRRSEVRDFIATREYFPSSWERAVRQKGRWIHGIVIQGRRLLRFEGPWTRRYFLWRDRKGPLVAILGLAGMMFLGASLLARLLAPVIWPMDWTAAMVDAVEAQRDTLMLYQVALALLSLNLLMALWRVGHRMRSVWWVHDAKASALSALRLPVINVLNFAASFRAYQQARQAERDGRAPAWVKTTHELPADFGLAQPKIETARETTQVSPPEAST